MEQNVVPIKFEAEIGGFFGGYRNVKLRKGTLIYFHGHIGDEEVEFHPTLQEWAEFRRALDQIDVWKWLRKYDSETCDGTQWLLKIKYPDRSMNADGSNAYPGVKGAEDEEMTVEFSAFLAAVKKLIGGRDF